MAKKPAPKEKKAAGAKEKKKSKGLWELYEVADGKLSRKAPWSPKLGSGYFMAVHKNRKTCGQTHYTEFAKKEEAKE